MSAVKRNQGRNIVLNLEEPSNKLVEHDEVRRNVRRRIILDDKFS